MEEVNKIQDSTSVPSSPEDQELHKLYQEYLQKCCEAGQIRYQLSRLESQQREMEKNLEVTERSVSSAAHKHQELQREKFSKIKPAESKLELKESH